MISTSIFFYNSDKLIYSCGKSFQSAGHCWKHALNQVLSSLLPFFVGNIRADKKDYYSRIGGIVGIL